MLTIVMSTYFPTGHGGELRAQGAYRCLDNFTKYLATTEDNIRLCVADDGSPEHIEYIDSLLLLAEGFWSTHSLYTNSERRGIGGSLNKAIAAVPDADLIMYTTDDWLLTEKLDVDPAIRLIKEGYDYVRVGPIHPNLNCITRFNTTIGWWLDISGSYGYAFATRPFIARRRFFDVVGPFDESLNAYETERLYTERVHRCSDRVTLAQLGGISLHGPWEHIGEYEVGTINP